MSWIKKGLIYLPDGTKEWAQSHAHVVCVDDTLGDLVRVYYSSRDSKGRCMASYLDLDGDDLSKVLYVHPRPILSLGVPGTFDDCGIMPTWFIKTAEEMRLYYIGWNVRNTIPYHNSLGFAVSQDGINFKKAFDGPVIDRIPTEPQFSGSACVLFDQGKYKIWYLNCTHWHSSSDGKLEPCYHIKYAESNDGIYWKREGKVAIDYFHPNEGGISRPSVLIEDGLYKMWFSYRAEEDYRDNINKSYRIGYAESIDGINWQRKDHEAGIDISATGWDSQMIEYPLVFKHRGNKILFYNGNGFGRTGFGYALYQK